MTDEMITISLKAEPEVIAKLDAMVQAEDTDRSKLIRKLIRQEFEERQDPTLKNYREKFARSPKGMKS